MPVDVVTIVVVYESGVLVAGKELPAAQIIRTAPLAPGAPTPLPLPPPPPPYNPPTPEPTLSPVIESRTGVFVPAPPGLPPEPPPPPPALDILFVPPAPEPPLVKSMVCMPIPPPPPPDCPCPSG